MVGALKVKYIGCGIIHIELLCLYGIAYKSVSIGREII